MTDQVQIAVASNLNVIVGNTGTVLTEIATSESSTTDPVTQVRTDTATGPLFDVTAVTQPGAGPALLPLVTVTIHGPPVQVLTSQATSITASLDAVSGTFTETIVTPLFTISAVVVGGVVTLTLTMP